MNLKSFFIGISATFFTGWCLAVLVPFAQLGSLGPHQDPVEEVFYPKEPTGLAMAGERVYRDQGCVYCHSQVIVPESAGSDIEKGWGPRKTVARDYIYRDGALVGIRRFGPDLAFTGWAERGFTRDYLMRHLFDPTLDNPDSEAPSFRFLFREQKVVSMPSNDAIDATGSKFAPPEGYEIVPKREAEELVTYLLSLNPSYSLPEAPMPEPDEEGDAEGEEGGDEESNGEPAAEAEAEEAA